MGIKMIGCVSIRPDDKNWELYDKTRHTSVRPIDDKLVQQVAMHHGSTVHIVDLMGNAWTLVFQPTAVIGMMNNTIYFYSEDAIQTRDKLAAEI
jgi:hypothetical protein